MGIWVYGILADIYRRAKLSHDPNNTTWSRSSTKYGQRILESQGWIPGDFLGATNAQHAALHTKASASHITIALKDDNLGLGARCGSDREGGPTTGLDNFQTILGRLNGKSEAELEKERNTRSSVQCSAFVNQRLGKLRFVSGGLLEGDRLQTLPERQSVIPSSSENALGVSQTLEPGKKAALHESPLEVSHPKKRKQTKLVGEQDCLGGTIKDCLGGMPIQDPKEPPSGDISLTQNSPSHDRGGVQRAVKNQRKAEKAARKLKRKLRRVARHTSIDQTTATAPDLEQLISDDTRPSGNGGDSSLTSIMSDSVKVSRTPRFVASGRNAVRQRNIRHKRMSMMDSKALNEVGSLLASLFAFRMLMCPRY